MERKVNYTKEFKVQACELVAKVGRKRKLKKKKLSDEQYLSENLVKDKFEETTPNSLWCTDLSEMQCRNNKIYVSAIIDVASRRIVSAMVEKHSRQKLVQETIKLECCQTKIPDGAIFHSDRGCQYTTKKTKELLEHYGFGISMSRPGTPSDIVLLTVNGKYNITYNITPTKLEYH